MDQKSEESTSLPTICGSVMLTALEKPGPSKIDLNSLKLQQLHQPTSTSFLPAHCAEGRILHSLIDGKDKAGRFCRSVQGAFFDQNGFPDVILESITDLAVRRLYSHDLRRKE